MLYNPTRRPTGGSLYIKGEEKASVSLLTAGSGQYPSLTDLFLVSVLAKTLLTLVRGDLSLFPFFPTGHILFLR